MFTSRAPSFLHRNLPWSLPEAMIALPLKIQLAFLPLCDIGFPSWFPKQLSDCRLSRHSPITGRSKNTQGSGDYCHSHHRRGLLPGAGRCGGFGPHSNRQWLNSSKISYPPTQTFTNSPLPFLKDYGQRVAVSAVKEQTIHS